jgi:hypothetical protein
MVVSGLPIRNGDNHAGEIASMSLKLLKEIKNFTVRHRPDYKMSLRIGMHSGISIINSVCHRMHSGISINKRVCHRIFNDDTFKNIAELEI